MPGRSISCAASRSRWRAGETLGLVGPSGSGKSSLLMLMGGLEAATSGRVTALGQDLTAMGEDALARFRRDHMGVVFQSFHLIPTMTAIENVATPLELAGAADAFGQAAAELEAMGLGARRDHYPAQLSGGEQQRVALARAAVARPRILLADEPTGNLDGATGAAIIELLFGLRDRHGATLVLVTHAPEIATRCDRVVRLRDGGLEPFAEAANEPGKGTPPRPGRAPAILPLRLALRELRGGLAGFRVFLACLALGVAAIAAVGSVRAAIGHGLAREAAALLGGDAEIEFTYRFADPAERAWMEANAAAVSEIVDFRSLLAVPRPGAEPERALVQVKAVDAGYPLYRRGRPRRRRQPRRGAGRARTACPGWWRRRCWSTASASRPAPWSASAPRTSASPTRSSPSPTASPPASASAPASSCAAPISPPAASSARARCSTRSYRLRLAPDADLAALSADAGARFADAGLQWRDRRSGPPGHRPLRRPARRLPRPRRPRRPRRRRRRRRRGGARAPRGQDRDHRHAEDPRRHRRHRLRHLPDRDRPPRAPRHRRSASPSAPRCRSSRRRSSPSACRSRPSSASTPARSPRPRSTAS